VGDSATLLRIAREFGVTAFARVEDFNSPAFVEEVKAAERIASSTGISAVPQITFLGTVVATGAQKEELLVASIRQILGTTFISKNNSSEHKRAELT